MTATTDGAFERVCALDEVPTEEALGVTVGDLEIALGRDGDEVFAIQDVCSHAEVALSEGEVAVTGGTCQIECWLHGSMFDLRTGKPTGPPATEPVALFPVEVRADGVYVDPTRTLNGVTPG
jgi:3-phenylpropionate/trans-cinnamate dioxygenase ferredoxin component